MNSALSVAPTLLAISVVTGSRRSKYSRISFWPFFEPVQSAARLAMFFIASAWRSATGCDAFRMLKMVLPPEPTVEVRRSYASPASSKNLASDPSACAPLIDPLMFSASFCQPLVMCAISGSPMTIAVRSPSTSDSAPVPIFCRVSALRLPIFSMSRLKPLDFASSPAFSTR